MRASAADAAIKPILMELFATKRHKNAQKSAPSFFRGFSCLFVANQNLLSSRLATYDTGIRDAAAELIGRAQR